MSMPSEQIATICVVHMMRHLMNEFINNTSKEADKVAQIKDDLDFQSSSDVKIPAI